MIKKDQYEIKLEDLDAETADKIIKMLNETNID